MVPAAHQFPCETDETGEQVAAAGAHTLPSGLNKFGQHCGNSDEQHPDPQAFGRSAGQVCGFFFFFLCLAAVSSMVLSPASPSADAVSAPAPIRSSLRREPSP